MDNVFHLLLGKFVPVPPSTVVMKEYVIPESQFADGVNVTTLKLMIALMGISYVTKVSSCVVGIATILLPLSSALLAEPDGISSVPRVRGFVRAWAATILKIKHALKRNTYSVMLGRNYAGKTGWVVASVEKLEKFV